MEVYERAAYKRGVRAAKAAASWCLDGNTSQEHIARMVEMFDTGDPELYDFLPNEPNLSGEWADDLTPRSLYLELVSDNASFAREYIFPGMTREANLIEVLADAFEQGVRDTFEAECERLYRSALA